MIDRSCIMVGDITKDVVKMPLFVLCVSVLWGWGT